jgi:hypothetical protein
MDQLSKTFREAIHISRKLNIEYIWIDSLCIIQDDHLDWQKESAKMASIYRNAYITIAATRAKDGDEGLFTLTPDLEIAGDTPKGEKYRLCFRREIDHVYALEKLSLDLYPLLLRGWAFPRTTSLNSSPALRTS